MNTDEIVNFIYSLIKVNMTIIVNHNLSFGFITGRVLTTISIIKIACMDVSVEEYAIRI